MGFHDPSPFSEQETRFIDMDPTVDINRVIACVQHAFEEAIEPRKIGDVIANSRSGDRVFNSLEER